MLDVGKKHGFALMERVLMIEFDGFMKRAGFQRFFG
jgi:hypothetical protein